MVHLSLDERWTPPRRTELTYHRRNPKRSLGWINFHVTRHSQTLGRHHYSPSVSLPLTGVFPFGQVRPTVTFGGEGRRVVARLDIGPKVFSVSKNGFRPFTEQTDVVRVSTILF